MEGKRRRTFCDTPHWIGPLAAGTTPLLLRHRTPQTKAVRGDSCAACPRDLPITRIEEGKGQRGRKAEKQRREELRGQRG
jgi:hypothetical protein